MPNTHESKSWLCSVTLSQSSTLVLLLERWGKRHSVIGLIWGLVERKQSFQQNWLQNFKGLVKSETMGLAIQSY